MAEGKSIMESAAARNFLALALAAILFLAVNVAGERILAGARIDLTEDQLFTLSDGTADLLANLNEPVSLRFFFSKKAALPYPSILQYGNRVGDMLGEFEALAGGNIDLQIMDPEPFSEDEDTAVAAGMQGVPTAGGDTLYMGLVASDSTDQQTVIPFFAQEREAFLEYDLAKIIHSLSQAKKPRIALLTSLPMEYGPGGIMAFVQGKGKPYVIYQQLQQFFEIENMTAGFAAIPEDISVLLIVHPPALADRQLYLIDQYVLAGGHAVIFLDAFAEAAAASLAAGPSTGAAPVAETSDLGPLLGAWGVEMVSSSIVADLELGQKVDMGGGGPRAVRDYVVWLGLRPPYMSDQDIVSAAVNSLNFASAGALRQIEGATTGFQPIVWSSGEAALIPADSARGTPDPDDLIRATTPDGQNYTLVARLSGPAASAYPEAVPPVQEEEQAVGDSIEETPMPAAHLVRSEGGIRVLLGSDVDFFDDRFWVQVQDFFGRPVATPFADNGAFVLNAVDHMAGSEALIGLRSRGTSQRPFRVVEQIRRQAEARFLAEEKRLQEKLTATEQRLVALESPGDMPGQTGAGLYNPEQEAEIQAFRQERLQTRRDLRQVQRDLRRDIDRLGNLLIAINILLLPLLLVLGAVATHYWKRRRSGISGIGLAS